MLFFRLVDPGVDGPGTGDAGYRHLSPGLFMETRAFWSKWTNPDEE